MRANGRGDIFIGAVFLLATGFLEWMGSPCGPYFCRRHLHRLANGNAASLAGRLGLLPDLTVETLWQAVESAAERCFGSIAVSVRG